MRFFFKIYIYDKLLSYFFTMQAQQFTYLKKFK